MPRKRQAARKPGGPKARRAKPRKAARRRRVPPSPIIFQQPGTLSFAILREAQLARDRGPRNEPA
jgi:hypothetical protein